MSACPVPHLGCTERHLLEVLAQSAEFDVAGFLMERIRSKDMRNKTGLPMGAHTGAFYIELSSAEDVPQAVDYFTELQLAEEQNWSIVVEPAHYSIRDPFDHEPWPPRFGWDIIADASIPEEP